MESITKEEVQETREVLSQFYGPVANYWEINIQVYEVLGRLIAESRKCTKAMHLVPRPWDLSNPIKWSQKQIRQAIIRYFKTPEGRHYITCIKVSASNFRVDFDMASQGL
jgi:hypothetical protein